MLNNINGRLIEYSKNMYRINHHRKFEKLGQISEVDKKVCFDFAYEMVFGEGKHRRNRSGGKKIRKSGEVFIDTFQGKIAEYAMYRYFLENGIITSEPDITVEGYGVWDSFDLEYGDMHIAIKSTKFYGNLLLLETKDWNAKGEYIPNSDCGTSKYDIFILIRLSPDGEEEMRKRMIIYSNLIDRNILEDTILNKIWEYDIAGFITNADLVRLINKKYVLPKGSLLNGRIPMDAENYYVQAGDMRPNQLLVNRLIKYKHLFEKDLTN
jgi:hypothetical protein